MPEELDEAFRLRGRGRVRRQNPGRALPDWLTGAGLCSRVPCANLLSAMPATHDLTARVLGRNRQQQIRFSHRRPG